MYGVVQKSRIDHRTRTPNQPTLGNPSTPCPPLPHHDSDMAAAEPGEGSTFCPCWQTPDCLALLFACQPCPASKWNPHRVPPPPYHFPLSDMILVARFVLPRGLDMGGADVYSTICLSRRGSCCDDRHYNKVPQGRSPCMAHAAWG